MECAHYWHVVKVVAFDFLGYLHPAKVLGRKNLNRSPEQGRIARTRACVLNLQVTSLPHKETALNSGISSVEKGCSPNELLQEGTRTVAGRKSKITTGFPKREELPQTGAFFLDDFVKICFCGPDLQEGMEEGREGGREQGKKGKEGSTKSRNTIINQMTKSPSAHRYCLAKTPSPCDQIRFCRAVGLFGRSSTCWFYKFNRARHFHVIEMQRQLSWVSLFYNDKFGDTKVPHGIAKRIVNMCKIVQNVPGLKLSPNAASSLILGYSR